MILSSRNRETITTVIAMIEVIKSVGVAAYFAECPVIYRNEGQGWSPPLPGKYAGAVAAARHKAKHYRCTRPYYVKQR